MSERLVAIDFFCGAGGLTRGLLDAGIQVLAGIDCDATLKDTYEKNNRPSKFLSSDISKVNIAELRKSLGVRRSDIVIYAACTPCQPFSTLNQRRGEDDRKSLLLAFAELVIAEPPDFIIVENVPGLNSAYGREIYEEFTKVLERTGFVHRFAKQLDAKDYGVPQVRKRFIMLASRKGRILEPRRSRQIKTVRDQIGSFPKLEAGDSCDSIPNHVSKSLKPHLERIVLAIPKNGGSRSDVTDDSILLKCHRDRPKVHKDVFGRMCWDKPAPTLTCRCTDVYCGRFVHPDQNRGISIREAAALQTFPNEYVFYGESTLQLARQIGNAVPVELAKRLGRAVIRSARMKE
jgi:DNA (cytosine-5)-methyltransferase 1